MFAAAVLLAVVAALAYHFFLAGPTITRNGQSLKRPPNTLPLAGNGLLFLRARHRLFSWFVKCERQFGFETFQISVPTLPPGVVVNDPKILEFVLKHEGVFTKGKFFKSRSWDLFGRGIINADGDLWKVQRKAGQHFLTTSNLKILTDVALPSYLKDTVRLLDNSTPGKAVDLQYVFHELTTQLMGRMAYDMDMHESDPFSQAFDFASGATGERFQNPLWQFTEIFLGSQFRKSVKEVQRFGAAIVSNAVKARKTKGNGIVLPAAAINSEKSFDGISGSLINSLLDSIDDPQVVADAALNYLSAGRDTTAQALTWTFYLLIKHPAVIAQVLEEITNLISASPNQHTPELDISELSPASLPYTLAVFYETLRFYPPIPFELRQCSTPTTLPDNTFLPASSILVWSPWAMNRSTTIWGPDADIFQPSRFLSPTSPPKIINRPAFEFPVFNGGSRTCLGKTMAEIIAVQTIATMVLKFSFEQAWLGEERRSRNSLTLPMEGGLPVLVSRRES